MELQSAPQPRLSTHHQQLRSFLHLGGFAVTSLFLLAGCMCPSPWCLETSGCSAPTSKSARMFLTPANQFSGLELEFVAAPCGLRLYINVFGLEIPPDDCDPSSSLVAISFRDHSYQFTAPRLLGGQRLLIPDDVRNEIVDYLQNGQPIFIQVGRYQADIYPDQFLPLFKQMI